jgi:phage regulator Rha-like protein
MDSTINLVQIIDEELYISHRIIAENTDNQAQNLKELIDDHKDKFELFGVIRFETEKGKGRPKVTYYLNEAQATLLLTFMRNNQYSCKF